MEPGEFWSVGDYAVVGELWSEPGRDLAASLGVADLDVIDLATGTGVTAIAMARNGARSVTGVDVTPRLLAEAARRAELAGVDVDWVEADFASVPRPDRSFDLVVSTFGLIFAAEPELAIVECRRLTRPGGRIVFTSWSADGLFGRLRQALGPYFPDVPEPWHERPESIRSMLGADVAIAEQSFVLRAPSPEEFVAQLEHHSAPFVLGAQAIGERWAQARVDLVDVVDSAGRTDGDGYQADVGYLVCTLAVD